MTANAFFGYLRRYAQIAIRFRRSFASTLKPFVLRRFASASEGVSDPVELERIRERIAQDVVRNYSVDDPNGEPFADTVLAWLRED